MKAVYGAVVLLVAAGAPVYAQAAGGVEADLARCAAVPDALQRLECYDLLSRRLGLEPKPAARAAEQVTTVPRAAAAASEASAAAGLPGPAKVGAWTVHIQRDDRDRVHRVTVATRAQSGQGIIGASPRLVLRCLDAELSVYVDWENYVGGNSVPVAAAIDGGKAGRANWPVSVDGSRTYYPGPAAAFAKELLGGRTLVMSVSPYGGHRISATFDVADLAQASDALRSACRW